MNERSSGDDSIWQFHPTDLAEGDYFLDDDFFYWEAEQDDK